MPLPTVTKTIKALNHEEQEGHEGKEELFFVLFVVPFFSGPFAIGSTAVILLWQNIASLAELTMVYSWELS